MNYIYIILAILIIFVLYFTNIKNIEHLTFDEMEKIRKADDLKKPIFNIIVDVNKLKNVYKHIKGLGSRTSLNVYNVNYNNDKNQRI